MLEPTRGKQDIHRKLFLRLGIIPRINENIGIDKTISAHANRLALVLHEYSVNAQTCYKMVPQSNRTVRIPGDTHIDAHPCSGALEKAGKQIWARPP